VAIPQAGLRNAKGIDMKLKYYMRGLGTGILLTAIILTMSYHSSSGVELSDAEIMRRAEQLGMEKADDGLKNILSEPTPIPSVKPTEVPLPTAVPTEVPKSEPTPKPTVTPVSLDSKKNKKQSDKTNKNVKPSEDKTVRIKIEKGMVSEEVAALLDNYGVVDNRKDFNEYLKKKGYTGIINYGVYELPLNAAYDQITDILIIK
jgi:hypothetical protein